MFQSAEAYLTIEYHLPIEYQEKFSAINSNLGDHTVIGYIALDNIPAQIVFCTICGFFVIFPLIMFCLRR